MNVIHGDPIYKSKNTSSFLLVFRNKTPHYVNFVLIRILNYKAPWYKCNISGFNYKLTRFKYIFAFCLIAIQITYNNHVWNSSTSSAVIKLHIPPLHLFRTPQTNVLSVCRSSQFVSHINIALTWVYFSNLISQGCLLNCITAVGMKWKFLTLEMYSDSGVAFWYLDKLNCFDGWCQNSNDVEKVELSHVKQGFSGFHVP